jgi:hypothetical protein
VPADGKVIVNCPPGAIVEFHAPLLAVDVCAVLSLLVQVTLPPTATVTGFGEYAVLVRKDEPLTIETGVPVPGVGVVVGADGVDEDPQP